MTTAHRNQDVPLSAASRHVASPATCTLRGVGGALLHVRRWQPDGTPRATVVVVHGFAEHGGRYAHVAQRLVVAGCAVVAADLRGHGRSSGKRRGIRRFQQYVGDLRIVVRWAAAATPAPVVALGHSMGGLVALAYAAQHEQTMHGLILSAPAVLPGKVDPLRLAAGRVLSVVVPDAPALRLPLRCISRDPAVVDTYMSDPLVCAGPMRARLGAEMLDTMLRVHSALPSLSMPLLAMQGTDDRLVDARAARYIDERWGGDDHTLREYDGLWHEIFNEPECDTVLDDVVRWLNEHTSSPA